MRSLNSPLLRLAMVLSLVVCYAGTQSTPQAEAIAGASTSSGDPCLAECTQSTVDCGLFYGYYQYGGNFPSQCLEYHSVCDYYCDTFGSPFNSWWLF